MNRKRRFAEDVARETRQWDESFQKDRPRGEARRESRPKGRERRMREGRREAPRGSAREKRRRRRVSSSSSGSTSTISSSSSSSSDTPSSPGPTDDSKRKLRRKLAAPIRSEVPSIPDSSPAKNAPEDASRAQLGKEAKRGRGEMRKLPAEEFTNPDLEAELEEEKRGGRKLTREDQDYVLSKSIRLTQETPTRAGGVYIPPFKLARLQKAAPDKTSVEYQRQAWEALRKSLNGLVNKVNVSNITYLVQELFKENLIRGRGLLCRAIIRAQMASPGFTHVYAALLAILNSKLPEIGELVLKRIVLQFRRAYRRNDKVVCLACVKFLAHIVNQRMGHELIALQLAALLLEKTTDDSVEVCVGFLKDVGQTLNQVSRAGFDAIFERLRAILHEGETTKKTQYTIESLWDLRRKNFQDYPAIMEGLDLVEEDEQICHELDLLDEDIKGEEMLNVFKAKEPEEYMEEDEKWGQISKEILGEETSDSEASSSDSESDHDDDGGADAGDDGAEEADGKPTQVIKDYTEQELINLRKTVYLSIMSSINFEECTHKLLKLNIRAGREIEVCTMLIDCCAMERTFQKFFVLQAERLCRLSPVYCDCFQEAFRRQYAMVHRLETSKLRNTAKFFAHLLYTDAVTWVILEEFKLSEETTTSSGRIFIKIILQELSEHMGLKQLRDRFADPKAEQIFRGLFPNDHPKNIRFAINFFTAIGLGGLTDDLRELLQKLQQEVQQMQQQEQQRRNQSGSDNNSSDSSSDSDSSDSSDDSSDSD